jgi:hypothetical protein
MIYWTKLIYILILKIEKKLKMLIPKLEPLGPGRPTARRSSHYPAFMHHA